MGFMPLGKELRIKRFTPFDSAQGEGITPFDCAQGDGITFYE
jgi:hypothetical protein